MVSIDDENEMMLKVSQDIVVGSMICLMVCSKPYLVDSSSKQRQRSIRQ